MICIIFLNKSRDIIYWKILMQRQFQGAGTPWVSHPLKLWHPPVWSSGVYEAPPWAISPLFLKQWIFWCKVGQSCIRHLRSKICVVCGEILSFKMRIEWFHRTKFYSHLISNQLIFSKCVFFLGFEFKKNFIN